MRVIKFFLISVFFVSIFSLNAIAEDTADQVQNTESTENTEDKMSDGVYPTPRNIEFEIRKTDFTETEIGILQSLEAKRIDLERKSQLLIIREKLLDISESKLLDKIEKLERLEANIRKLLEDVSEEENKRLNSLTTVYSEMKASLAAERLNILDDNTVYEILKRMNYKKAAKILEKMDLKKVEIISEMLADKTHLPEAN